eukprot:gene12675-9068_t
MRTQTEALETEIKYLAAMELIVQVIESKDQQRKKVSIMFDEVRSWRLRYDPFIRKRTQNLVFASTFDEITENIALIAKEKVVFTGKVRVLKVKEGTAELQKIESDGGDERRKVAMENKKHTKRGQDVDAISTESYINSSSYKCFGTRSSCNNGDLSTDARTAEDTASDNSDLDSLDDVHLTACEKALC